MFGSSVCEHTFEITIGTQPPLVAAPDLMAKLGVHTTLEAVALSRPYLEPAPPPEVAAVLLRSHPPESRPGIAASAPPFDSEVRR